jgi:hypothetical protein
LSARPKRARPPVKPWRGDISPPERQDITQDTPVSISGGGNAIGFAGTFSATATNVGGGYAAAYGNEGIDNPDTYNQLGGTGVDGDASAAVQYTIRVVGPTTGALVPVHVTMSAYAGSLDVPGPVDGYYAPVIASTEAQVTLGYAEGDVPVGDPQLPYVQAHTIYDYRYFESAGYAAPDLLGNGDTFDAIVMIEANFDVAVDVVAEVSARFTGLAAAYSESAGGSAYADPTFTIDDPAYADYTITGVPAGPAAMATPEPSTWAMMLLGFGGLAYTGYRRKVCATSRAA